MFSNERDRYLYCDRKNQEISTLQCPIDQTELVISERQGVEIDYCPKCRGVWLDRGELDKVIERSEPAGAGRPGFSSRGMRDEYRDDDDRNRDECFDDDDDGGRRGGRKKRKRESFLGDLFDF
jgi:Zn-finger nucleic acid-binding protein